MAVGGSIAGATEDLSKMNFSALLPLTLAALAGAMVAAQPAFNAQLAGHLGSPLRAALVNFTAGAAIMLTVTGALAFRAGLPTLSQIDKVPLHLWVVGGALGAFFVSVAAWGAPKLGVGAFFAFVIAAQLITAMALDHFGLLGLDARPATWMRWAGAVLLIAGAVMMLQG